MKKICAFIALAFVLVLAGCGKKDTVAIFMPADKLVAEGKYDEAYKLYEALGKKHDVADVAANKIAETQTIQYEEGMKLGREYLASGEYDKAFQYYQAANDTKPDDADEAVVNEINDNLAYIKEQKVLQKKLNDYLAWLKPTITKYNEFGKSWRDQSRDFGIGKMAKPDFVTKMESLLVQNEGFLAEAEKLLLEGTTGEINTIHGNYVEQFKANGDALYQVVSESKVPESETQSIIGLGKGLDDIQSQQASILADLERYATDNKLKM